MKIMPISFPKNMVDEIVREVDAPGTGKTMTRRLTSSKYVTSAAGDMLWVQEKVWVELLMGKRCYNIEQLQRRLSQEEISSSRGLSRLSLQVTAVRTEPLHAITAADALREGVADVDDYRDLWAVLSEKYGLPKWKTNPQVVVISFIPHMCNVDKIVTCKNFLQVATEVSP
jgi:hypothetical protein